MQSQPITGHESLPRGTGVRFSEQMSGTVAPVGDAAATSRAVMRGTVAIANLDDFLEDPNHGGLLAGRVRIDALAPGWVPAEGHVRLFSMGSVPGERLMEYFMTFEVQGERYDLAGTKYVLDHRGFDVWTDVTTLHTSILRHEPNGQRIPVLTGVLRLTFLQSLVLALTLRGTGDGGFFARIGSVARFSQFFLSEVAERFLPAAQRHPTMK